jgi:hypothetical protein
MVRDEQGLEKVCWYIERLEDNPQGGGGLKTGAAGQGTGKKRIRTGAHHLGPGLRK